ncbi:hypothetical protein [Geothrix sp.]|uniref:hypothetical protein n=1 Tax=Geothrix sp. TaxID=1962974 RepID=UPI0025BCFA30|nr:hypothetical protein [Geothrix sp.]
MQISGIQTASTTSGTTALKALAYDPRDTNQDGVVSAAEDQAYTLRHPQVEILRRLREGRSASRTEAVAPSPYGPRETPNLVAASDPRDANRNGQVSPAEDLAYALAHPKEDPFRAATRKTPVYESPYGPQGRPSAGFSARIGAFDVLA